MHDSDTRQGQSRAGPSEYRLQLTANDVITSTYSIWQRADV